MIALSNIAQGSAVMGMAVLQKKNAQAQEVNIPAGISCYLGVTELAIFGVNLKHGFPFISGMIGSGIAAIICVATSTTANAIGVGGLPGILSIQPGSMASFAICMVVAIVVPLALTIMIGRKKLAMEDRYGVADADEAAQGEMPIAVAAADMPKELKAFLTGEVIPLEEVKDGVFSEKVMGDGFAILPETDVLYAPADAEVAVLMEDSRHACGLKLANGMEILLHIGLDTVDMKGDGFEYLISQGQYVKAGDALIRFDRDKIKAAGHRDVTVCVITEEGKAENIRFMTGMHAVEKETVVAVFE